MSSPTLEQIFRGTLEESIIKLSHNDAVTYLERLGFKFLSVTAFIGIYETKKKHALIYTNNDNVKIDIYRKER